MNETGLGLMFEDLLAAQKEMPGLQKTALNPHFGNKFVPLEELITTILPILHKHNMILTQLPNSLDGKPALTTALIHASGERLETTMLLLCAKDDPQGQGSAITYARRYSLMSLLGLTADADDDAETTRPKGGQERQTPQNYQRQQATVNAGNGHSRPPQPRQAAAPDVDPPDCPNGHGAMRYWPEETSRKTGKLISAKYKCVTKTCDDGSGWPCSVWADKWEGTAQMNNNREPVMAGADYEKDLPFDE